MEKLKLSVVANEISITEHKSIVSGTHGDTMSVTFSAGWDEYLIRAVWQYQLTEPFETVANADGTYDIPAEVIKQSGYFKVGFYGTKGDAITPTVWSEQIPILKGVPTSLEYEEPYPTLYEKLAREKQDKLVAGDGIKIEGNTISSNLAAGEGIKIEDSVISATSENGITPQLRINAETNIWEVSYDNGTTWESLGEKATGDKGNDGTVYNLDPSLYISDVVCYYDDDDPLPWSGISIYLQGGICTIQGMLKTTAEINPNTPGGRDILINLPFEPLKNTRAKCLCAYEDTSFADIEKVYVTVQGEDNSVYFSGSESGSTVIPEGSVFCINMAFAIKTDNNESLIAVSLPDADERRY